MKTIKKNKKNNRNQFGSKFDERTNVSLVFFWSWLKLIVIFFWPELKTQAKSLNDFFYFQISLFDFFCGLCPLDFFFVCFWSEKTNCGGHKPIIINFCPPKFVFFKSKTQKKQNPGDTSHKKNQISLFENKKIV